jgi:hypothetical protein
MVRRVFSGWLCAWRGGRAPRQSSRAQGCDSEVGERTEKASHEEALPVADGEEVAGSFRASFRGWRLEEVLHTVASSWVQKHDGERQSLTAAAAVAHGPAKSGVGHRDGENG